MALVCDALADTTECADAMCPASAASSTTLSACVRGLHSFGSRLDVARAGAACRKARGDMGLAV